jgi:hypothetical protein
MIHKIVFWKPATTGVASTDTLFFYAVLVAETPPFWKQPAKKVVAIMPIGDDAPQPSQLIDFVEAADEIAALNWAKETLATLPALKEHRAQISWKSK